MCPGDGGEEERRLEEVLSAPRSGRALLFCLLHPYWLLSVWLLTLTWWHPGIQDEGKKAQLEYEAEGGAPLKKPAFLKGQKQKGQVPPARVEPPDDKEAEAPSVSEEDAPEAESSEEESDRDAEAKARWARARGLAGPSSSSDDADESDSEGTSSDINADTLAEDEDDVRTPPIFSS